VTGRDVGASVRARLLARARGTRQDFSLVLKRYAIVLALTDVIAALGRVLLPVVEAAASNSPLQGQWKSGGGAVDTLQETGVGGGRAEPGGPRIQCWIFAEQRICTL
jgi:hypothetical protein